MRRRPRQDVSELAQRYQNLPREQAGRVGLVMFANALVSASLQVAVLVMGVQAVRRIRADRRNRSRATTAVTRMQPVIVASCLYGCYAVCNRVLLIRWVRQVIERFEHETKSAKDTAPQ